MTQMLRQCGVDEAGRGPWAGPVVAAAVVFRGAIPAGLADSKKLTARKREALFEQLVASCDYGIGHATAEEVDRLNILQATFLAMARAVQQLSAPADSITVDGNQVPPALLDLSPVVTSLVKGDSLMAEISAASILAKVTRDRYMADLSLRYPGYGFEKHSGYGVPAHEQALRELGVTVEHRKSFAPIRKLLVPA